MLQNSFARLLEAIDWDGESGKSARRGTEYNFLSRYVGGKFLLSLPWFPVVEHGMMPSQVKKPPITFELSH